MPNRFAECESPRQVIRYAIAEQDLWNNDGIKFDDRVFNLTEADKLADEAWERVQQLMIGGNA